MNALIPSEAQEQGALMEWFRTQYPGVLIYAIPNGAYLAGDAAARARQMAKLKWQGLVAGIPDLCIPQWECYIEMKRTKNGVLSQEQSEIHKYLRECGYTVIVARGWEDAMRQLAKVAA